MGHAAVESQHAGAGVRLDALVQHQLRAVIGLGQLHAAAGLIQRGQLLGFIGGLQGGRVQHGAQVGVQYTDLAVDLLQRGDRGGQFSEGILKFHVSSSFLKQKIPVRKITFKYQTIVSQNTIAG